MKINTEYLDIMVGLVFIWNSAPALNIETVLKPSSCDRHIYTYSSTSIAFWELKWKSKNTEDEEACEIARKNNELVCF